MSLSGIRVQMVIEWKGVIDVLHRHFKHCVFTSGIDVQPLRGCDAKNTETPGSARG